jgi:hypothetical protein
MKQKFQIFILVMICNQSSILCAQTSPIKWINNFCNINIDTTFKSFWGHYENYNSSNVLRYTFENIGEHVTFIDSPNFYRQYITKPNNTSTISLSSNIDYINVLKKRDTAISVYLPFYYEGMLYREKLTYNLTFGKSKLIEYDNLHIDATSFIADTIKSNSSVRFTHYFAIKNISKKNILCTKELITFNDTPGLESYDK